MPPRALPTAATAAAIALGLLLTACGGDDGDDTSDDKIQGGEQADESPSPSASASAEEAAEPPEIELPKDITYDFAWAKTGDPEKDAVLRDGEQLIKSIDLAIAEQDPTHEAMLFYTEGKAAVETDRFIQLFVDDKSRTTGRYRFYNEQVEINDDGTATLLYCEDQGKAYNKSLKTGKVDVTPVTEDSYLVYNTNLRKNDDGVWVTEQAVSERGAEQCQP